MTGVDDSVVLADELGRGISGDLTKPLVDREDPPCRVGNRGNDARIDGSFIRLQKVQRVELPRSIVCGFHGEFRFCYVGAITVGEPNARACSGTTRRLAFYARRLRSRWRARQGDARSSVVALTGQRQRRVVAASQSLL